MGRVRIDWRDRETWQRIGYTATAAWMLAVLVITGSDVTHPLFDYIFVVPLAGWILGLLVARLVARRPPPADPPPAGNGTPARNDRPDGPPDG